MKKGKVQLGGGRQELWTGQRGPAILLLLAGLGHHLFAFLSFKDLRKFSVFYLLYRFLASQGGKFSSFFCMYYSILSKENRRKHVLKLVLGYF